VEADRLLGRGATVVWNEGTPKLTFDWEKVAVIAIPLNAWHEIHNGSGSEPVRLYAASNMPTPFNLYGSPEFIFNCANTFNDRFDLNDETFFNRKATKIEDRLLQSNFIPSVTKLALDNWAYRGPGTNMHVLMAGGQESRTMAQPQIEYKDEQPEIRVLFREECRKRGVKFRMTYS
jgi:hypothetical protein